MDIFAFYGRRFLNKEHVDVNFDGLMSVSSY